MVRSNAENLAWWNKLSLLERDELFEDLLNTTRFARQAGDFIESLKNQYRKTGTLSQGHINALRKYADNL